MRRKAQEQFGDAVVLKLRRKKMSIKALAGRIGRERTIVSRAINHPMLPKVKRLIAIELGIPFHE